MQQNIRHQFADAEELVDSGSFVVVVLLYNPQLQSKMGAIVLYPSRFFNKVRNIDLRKRHRYMQCFAMKVSVDFLQYILVYRAHIYVNRRNDFWSAHLSTVKDTTGFFSFSPAAPFYSSVRYSVRKYCTYDVDFLQILIYSRLYVFSLCEYSFSYLTLSSLFLLFFL